jgi:hypothetical protein
MLPNGVLVPITLAVDAGAGDTAGDSWSRLRGALSLGIETGGRGLSLELEAGASADDTPLLERFEIGGSRGSILPDGPTANRIDLPALPTGVLRGARYDSARLEIRPGRGMPTVFVQRIQADVVGGDDEIGLAGLEWTTSVDAMPIARIPALELRAGAARVFDDGILADETSFWVTLRWKP